MQNVIAWLRGKKTYLCAAALFIVYGCEGMGWISQAVAEVLKGVLLPLTVVSARAALARRE